MTQRLAPVRFPELVKLYGVTPLVGEDIQGTFGTTARPRTVQWLPMRFDSLLVPTEI